MQIKVGDKLYHKDRDRTYYVVGGTESLILISTSKEDIGLTIDELIEKHGYTYNGDSHHWAFTTPKSLFDLIKGGKLDER